MSDIAQDETEIRRVHREWWASNVGLDVERMRACFAPDYLMWNLNGHPYYSLEEKVALFRYYQQHMVPTDPPELWDIRVTVSGDMAYVTSEGILPVTVTSEEGSGSSLIDAMAPRYERRGDQVCFRFRETSVLRRDDGAGKPEWRIWHFHCSPLAAEAEPRPCFGDTARQRGRRGAVVTMT
ncbi:MAG: nuclear transport factor 2 family protein [Actinobacteria bacterium]|nr:nuclear transport factor 2 family protein [Actinomycetota bacterium]